MLAGNFSNEEIKQAVWDCGCENAPGPDRFTFKFYKSNWEIIKNDVIKMVKHFEASSSFSAGCNSSFIALFPKVDDPLSLKDFRPISLIGSAYKIVAKILASRLKRVVDKIISKEQTAFVENRQILDGPMMLNEVIGWIKRTKKQAFFLKIDFEKAFDSISWDFLDSIMIQMHFNDRWRGWIKGCLSSARASVLINGSPTCEFPLFRGLRQGDPLSPFLFIIAMEGLHVALSEAVNSGVFKGLSLPNNGPILSHFFFADDAIFLGNWSIDNLLNIKRILNCFHLSSGLKVNFLKSKVFCFGISDFEKAESTAILKCDNGKVPFNYLGVSIGAKMGTAKNWDMVIEKINRKLSTWKSKNISFAGKSVLCKSVLGSIPLYHMSLYKAPKKVTKEIDKLRRKFLWGSNRNGNTKICWVDWKTMTAPKHMGGFGIGVLEHMNISLLIKWWWRFKQDNAALWSKVIKAIHGVSGSDKKNMAKKSFSGPWSKIVKVGCNLADKNIQLDELIVKPTGKNKWRWELNDDGVFTRTLLNKIPTKVNLQRRGIILPSYFCLLCGEMLETRDHLFMECSAVKKTWNILINWCNIDIRGTQNDLGDFVKNIRDAGGFKSKNRFLEAVTGGMIWLIWMHRNNKVFKNARFEASGFVNIMIVFPSTASQQPLLATTTGPNYQMNGGENYHRK